MVFEQLYATHWLRKRAWFTFILAFCYTIIGIGSAGMIFGSYPGLMSIAFIAILLIPTMNILLSSEAKVTLRKKEFSIKLLFRDHKDILAIYFFSFLGMFCMYFLVSAISPSVVTERLFGPQLAAAGVATGKVAAFTGHAFKPGIFVSLMLNNIKVFIVCLFLSFIFGAGAVLFLTWNASVWGVVFGYVLRQSAVASGHPVAYFGVTILPYLPHLVTEALAYLSAAIAGGVLSKAALREELHTKRFNRLLIDALLLALMGFALVGIAAFIEAGLF